MFALQPVVNPMLGPSSSALINVGARFPPCMKDVTTVPVSTQFPCTPALSLCPQRARTNVLHRHERYCQPARSHLHIRIAVWVWRHPCERDPESVVAIHHAHLPTRRIRAHPVKPASAVNSRCTGAYNPTAADTRPHNIRRSRRRWALRAFSCSTSRLVYSGE